VTAVVALASPAVVCCQVGLDALALGDMNVIRNDLGRAEWWLSASLDILTTVLLGVQRCGDPGATPAAAPPHAAAAGGPPPPRTPLLVAVETRLARTLARAGKHRAAARHLAAVAAEHHARAVAAAARLHPPQQPPLQPPRGGSSRAGSRGSTHGGSLSGTTALGANDADDTISGPPPSPDDVAEYMDNSESAAPRRRRRGRDVGGARARGARALSRPKPLTAAAARAKKTWLEVAALWEHGGEAASANTARANAAEF